MVEHEGKKFLPEYLDTLLTKEGKEKWNTLIRTSSRVTIKDYPPEASFLIEHDRKTIGHIPEHILQESANEDYKRSLVKHTKLPQELLNMVSWDILGEAISKLNLAKLLPVLKFINNEWSTGDKMKNYYQKDPKCPVCGAQEELKHVFDCNSARVKQTRTVCIYSINMILSKSYNEYSQWWCLMINGCFISLGATPN